ncbi:MAG: hypothetical protein HY986_02965 [Candidatus Melainabacteria bacterium]|nr:hypothetical protein [Candidatus Melainabacteria bacterium]
MKMAKTYSLEEMKQNFVNYFSYTVGIQVLVFTGCLLANYLKTSLTVLGAIYSFLFIAFSLYAAIPFCLSLYFLTWNFRSGKALGLFTASIVCLLVSAAGCALGSKILT